MSAEKPPGPVATAASFEILRPFVTERISELVGERLLGGLKFFNGHTLRPEFSRWEAKLTLLLVRLANPREYLSEDEIGLLESGSKNGQMHSSASLPHHSAQKPQKPARSQKRRKQGP